MRHHAFMSHVFQTTAALGARLVLSTAAADETSLIQRASWTRLGSHAPRRTQISSLLKVRSKARLARSRGVDRKWGSAMPHAHASSGVLKCGKRAAK